MNTSDIQSMTANEKLKLVTQLWDEIAASSESIAVPSEIVSEAVRRSKEFRADPAIGIDDDELWRRVDG